MVTGTEWTDQVCLTDNACVNDFKFFLIEKNSEPEDSFEGYLGLARYWPFEKGSLKSSGVTRGPSFVRELVN